MRRVFVPFAVAWLVAFAACEASAVTVCAKTDLRQWETVTDRSRPLAWSWEDGADEALIVATLVQKSGGVEIAHETVERAGTVRL